MGKDASLTSIQKLVDKFQRDSSEYLDKKFDEANTKQFFINELFLHLGWDVYFKKDVAPSKREVWLEDTVEANGSLKRVDYAFTINGFIKFFVEAKAAHVNLDDKKHIYQIKEYAWNEKVQIGILTNFRSFKVYDCRYKPNIDNPNNGLLIEFSTDNLQYEEIFEKLYSLFSYESVYNGSIDNYIASKKKLKGQEVDDVFLADLEEWRIELAKNIFQNNFEKINNDERILNHVVQKTLDRIMFTRVMEDRGILNDTLLDKCIDSENIYNDFKHIFKNLDHQFNGAIFKADITDDLVVDNEILLEIIKHSYPKFNKSSYRFDILKVEILGAIYERFLGSVIKIENNGNVIVEMKPEVKKAGGVFYTPKYIVDYMVSKVVAPKLKGKVTHQAGGKTSKDPESNKCWSNSSDVTSGKTLFRGVNP